MKFKSNFKSNAKIKLHQELEFFGCIRVIVLVD